MSFTIAPVQELSSTVMVGLDGRCRVELTEKGEQALYERYAEVHGTDPRNTRRSVRDLFRRGHEHVFTLRQMMVYFGTAILPLAGMETDGDDLFVGNTLIFVPDTDVILLNGE